MYKQNQNKIGTVNAAGQAHQNCVRSLCQAIQSSVTRPVVGAGTPTLSVSRQMHTNPWQMHTNPLLLESNSKLRQQLQSDMPEYTMLAIVLGVTTVDCNSHE